MRFGGFRLRFCSLRLKRVRVKADLALLTSHAEFRVHGLGLQGPKPETLQALNPRASGNK